MTRFLALIRRILHRWPAPAPVTRRVHLMPWLFLILAALILAALLLATVHMAYADCIIGPGVVCPPDDPLPPMAYIPAIW